MKNAILQAVNLAAPMLWIMLKTSGMMSCAAPPPKFPQPAETALAVPITSPENMELIQNIVDTNVAREMPVKNRTSRKEVGDEIIEVQQTAGAVRRSSEAEARRAPNTSQAVPMAIRAKIAPETDAIPAWPISLDVRLRLSRMTGSRGAAAKLEMKHVK